MELKLTTLRSRVSCSTIGSYYGSHTHAHMPCQKFQQAGGICSRRAGPSVILTAVPGLPHHPSTCASAPQMLRQWAGLRDRSCFPVLSSQDHLPPSSGARGPWEHRNLDNSVSMPGKSGLCGHHLGCLLLLPQCWGSEHLSLS